MRSWEFEKFTFHSPYAVLVHLSIPSFLADVFNVDNIIFNINNISVNNVIHDAIGVRVFVPSVLGAVRGQCDIDSLPSFVGVWT